MTIRDRLWLWGMKVNHLEESGLYPGLPASTMSTEQAIQKTGIANVLMAGGLELDRQTLQSMPSARRILCKWALHRDKSRTPDHKHVVDMDRCLTALRGAKVLASEDTRIDGYLIDDFSTGAVEAGVKPEHLAQLQYHNAVEPPQLPLLGTIYTMSLDRPELPGLLPHFAGFVTPLYHAEEIDGLPESIDRLAGLSGGKPQLVCIYLWDFGNQQLVTYELMRRQLDVVGTLITEHKVTGAIVLGTCLMDLDWEANTCLDDWLREKGGQPLQDPA